MFNEIHPIQIDSTKPQTGILNNTHAEQIVWQMLIYCQTQTGEWTPVPISWLSEQIDWLGAELKVRPNLVTQQEIEEYNPSSVQGIQDFVGKALWILLKAARLVELDHDYLVANLRLRAMQYSFQQWCAIRDSTYAPYLEKGIQLPAEVIDEVKRIWDEMYSQLPRSFP